MKTYTKRQIEKQEEKVRRLEEAWLEARRSYEALFFEEDAAFAMFSAAERALEGMCNANARAKNSKRR